VARISLDELNYKVRLSFQLANEFASFAIQSEGKSSIRYKIYSSRNSRGPQTEEHF